MFLLSQIMDESRHLDVFRKRALANGGGLMQRPDITTSGVVGSIDLSREFTEMSSRLHISGEGAVLTLFRMGELMSYNEAEKRIYRLAAQDESPPCRIRRNAHALPLRVRAGAPRRNPLLPHEGERGLLAGNQNPAAIDTPSSEAMAILLGGGIKGYDEGARKLMAIRRRQVREYVQRIRSAGFGERFDNGRAGPPPNGNHVDITMTTTKQPDEQEQQETLQASAARVTEREAGSDDAEEVEIAPPNLAWMKEHPPVGYARQANQERPHHRRPQHRRLWRRPRLLG